MTIKSFLGASLSKAVENIALSRNIEYRPREIKIEYPPQPTMGHYASPIAMELAGVFKQNPRQIAEQINEELNKNGEITEYFSQIKIEGPGFLNFFLSPGFHASMLKEHDVAALQKTFYTSEGKEKVIFEFVSANPTGPLNIVSARAAAVGDSICRILEKAGYPVYREYYVNDYGNQVRLLGLSFAIRHLQSQGVKIELPEDAYQGEYIEEMRSRLVESNITPPAPPQELSSFNESGDIWKTYLDELGAFFAPLAIEKIRSTHEADLKEFGVEFDNFFSERTLHEDGSVEKAGAVLKEKGVVYESEGAMYFESTKYGDDKDRVIVRADGRPTYLLADIAYHKNKIDRGFEKICDIWGPDHHGYIARLSGAIRAMGFGDKERESFEVFIVQQVNMIEDGKPVVMSKRLGKFHTMRDLLKVIPRDVVRYFFLMRSQSSHLDFDLDLASTESNKNPVYYIQYAYARINSIFREAQIDISGEIDISGITINSGLLTKERELLLVHLWRYFEIVGDVAKTLEVHILADYLYEAANLFTSFYHGKENRILDKLKENPAEGKFLLRICQWTQLVIQDGLNLLGVSAPEKM